MTLASVPAYDPGQVTRKAGFVVVIGAGLAGLLHGERVGSKQFGNES